MKLLELLGYFNYWVFAVVLMVGLYAVIRKTNLIKKLIGLGLFQTSVLLFYISIGKVDGGRAPILSNPSFFESIFESWKRILCAN